MWKLSIVCTIDVVKQRRERNEIGFYTTNLCAKFYIVYDAEYLGLNTAVQICN